MSRHKYEKLLARERAAQMRAELPFFKLAVRDACLAVARFNATVHGRYPHMAWPTFRAAWYAERYFLGAFCEACKQECCIDIAAIDWHPDASINSLIPYLKCTRCGPGAPNAIITGLWKRPRMKVVQTRRFRRLPDDLPARRYIRY